MKLKEKMVINTLTPHEFKSHQQKFICHTFKTAAGSLQIQSTDLGICNAVFDQTIEKNIQQLSAITHILLVGTEFQIKVWKAALQIPAGTTITYHDIAQQIGHPKAYRAVANALGQNKIAFFVPCHRVIRKDGGLGGYAGGIEKKIALLKAEGVL